MLDSPLLKVTSLRVIDMLSAGNSTLRRLGAWGIGLLLVQSLLAGCASQLRHDVTVYHDWPGGLAERTFRLVRNADQKDSLKHATYERIVRTELLAAGFKESDTPALEISFTYTLGNKTIRYIESGPAFGSYFSFSHGYRHNGFSFAAPLYWGWPYYSTEHEVERYRRDLGIEIKDLRASPPRRIYEASASSSGNQPAMVAALPLLMKAVLADFPGRSGVARQVNLPLTQD